jgi:hypothetical protein
LVCCVLSYGTKVKKLKKFRIAVVYTEIISNSKDDSGSIVSTFLDLWNWRCRIGKKFTSNITLHPLPLMPRISFAAAGCGMAVDVDDYVSTYARGVMDKGKCRSSGYFSPYFDFF